jgi:rhodanese-related sulfurtransferase
MKTFFILLFIVCFLAISCKGQTSKNIKTVPATEFQKNLADAEKPQLVDVRTPEEYVSGHLDKAININWNDANFDAEMEKLNKTTPVYVYCKGGGRSGKAAKKLAEMGFTTIYDLDGGVTSWNANNLPLKK